LHEMPHNAAILGMVPVESFQISIYSIASGEPPYKKGPS
jgi:hypothetical protein